MSELPGGTLTVLHTEIEGSTLGNVSGKATGESMRKRRAAGRLRQSACPLTISEDWGAQRERRNSMNVFEPFESWDNDTNAAVGVPCAGPACIFWGTLCHLIL
jgi:hypothetical protein